MGKKPERERERERDREREREREIRFECKCSELPTSYTKNTYTQTHTCRYRHTDHIHKLSQRHIYTNYHKDTDAQTLHKHTDTPLSPGAEISLKFTKVVPIKSSLLSLSLKNKKNSGNQTKIVLIFILLTYLLVENEFSHTWRETIK